MPEPDKPRLDVSIKLRELPPAGAMGESTANPDPQQHLSSSAYRSGEASRPG